MYPSQIMSDWLIKSSALFASALVFFEDSKLKIFEEVVLLFFKFKPEVFLLGFKFKSFKFSNRFEFVIDMLFGLFTFLSELNFKFPDELCVFTILSDFLMPKFSWFLNSFLFPFANLLET
jgi:hypothetical protein